MERWIRITAVAVALAACLAVAGEGERVRGTGFSRTARPLVLDEPSDSFLEDADVQTDSEPRPYRGTGQYLLHQGGRLDDKLKYRSSDYVHWTALGAVLSAEGQCHDADPKETTRVSSEAWGGQVVEAKISSDEGEYGTISAENRIGFGYAYNISGSRILEATVQLSGNCIDILGGNHRFSLSDTRSESVTESLREVRVRGMEMSVGGRVSQSTGRSDGATNARSGSQADAGFSFQADDTIDMTITRALAQAGGDSGGASGPAVEDKVSGQTPIEKSYAVYSAGTVVLTARGDGADGGSGVTHVFLDHFTIENVLRVFKSVDSSPPPPPPTGPGDPGDPVDPPGSGGPASGGDGGSGGSGGGGSTDGTGDGASADGDAAADPEPVDETRTSGSMDLDGVDGLDGFRVGFEALAPFGLDGEPGGTNGELRVTLSAPAPRDLVFSVLVDPQGALEYPAGGTIRIPKGRQAGGGPLGDALIPDGAEAEAFVSIHLLEADGSPSGRELALRLPLVSTATRAAPRLYACADASAWLAGADAIVRGIRGTRAPDLVIGRLGFDGFATTTTTVAITVHDPDGVLSAVPSSVPLAPGEAETTVPLLLNDVEGIAVLTLAAGDESLDVTVVSRTQGWSSMPVIRVPLGATAAVPYRLRWSESDARSVQATVADGSAVTIVPGAESDLLPAGATLWATQVRGAQLGAATIRLESDGLDPLPIPVEVVPARVEFAGGALRLSNLPVGTSGSIHLRAPPGVRFEALAVPPELSDVITLDGLGGEELVLTLHGSPDLASALVLTVELAGSTASALVFDVFERLEEDVSRPACNNYQVEWK